MPEPVIWRYARQNTKTTAGPTYSTLPLKFVPRGFGEQPLYTAEALRDVLEQAAFMAEHINDGCLGAPDGPEEIAAAIRALIKDIQ